MQQDFETLPLEQWANFDFSKGAETVDSFRTELPDQQESDESEPDEQVISAPPAYQDLEIEIGQVPLYKRPHIKGIFFGSGVLLVCMLVGAVLTQGAGIELGNSATEETISETPTTDTELDPEQEKLSELEGEIAFSTLKNRAALLEEQQKQQVLTGALNEQAQEASNSAPPLTSSQSSSTLPAPRSSTAFNSYPPPSRPQSLPQPPSPQARSAPVKSEPTLVSFGALPKSAAIAPNPTPASLPTRQVTSPENAAMLTTATNLLAQQETAFWQNQAQFLVEAGQSIRGTVTQQMIAEEQALLNIRTEEALLGLPIGSNILAQITRVADGYITAEAIAILYPDQPAMVIPAGAMQLSAPDGKLLQTATDQSFLQTKTGRALLGVGRGLADQYISRSETFFQTESSTSITRGEGGKDLASLGGAALKGLADVLLAEPESESSVQLVNPDTAVQLTIQASFVIAQ